MDDTTLFNKPAIDQNFGAFQGDGANGLFYSQNGNSSDPMEMMNQEVRIIKKYPNRRLYDTAISSYITVEDVRSLVMQQVKFSIQDAKTGDDITRSVLLQIILEQEEGGEPIFSSEVLAQLIRFYGNTLQGLIANYFERSLTLFTKQQEEFHEKMYTPLSFMTDLAEQNITLWRDVQENFFRAALTGTLERDDKKKKVQE